MARSIERGVHLLDNSITIPGTKLSVGLDPILGMIFPAVGDAIGGFVSLGVLLLAVQYRVPTHVMTKMVLNVAVDSAVGAIPLVGDAFDFVWKANDRNFEMLMTHRGDLPKRSPVTYYLAVAGLLVAALLCISAPIALMVWLIYKFTH